MHQRERRRSPRYPLTVPSEVTDTDTSQAPLGAATVEVSRYGCSVQTRTPFPRGTRIKIRMSHAGSVFEAFGRVAYVTEEGMGIVFSIVEAEMQAILDEWLGVAAGSDSL